MQLWWIGVRTMCKIRVELTKGEAVRYISHLDYAAALERALRRAALPVAYSEGFNPHMKLSFASALAVGVTSDAEYMDVELKSPLKADDFLRRLRAALPQGIEAHAAVCLQGKQTALMALVDLASYEASAALNGPFAALETAARALSEAQTTPFVRVTPKGRKEIDLKAYLSGTVFVSPAPEGALLRMDIRITPTGSVKPSEVLRALRERFNAPIDEARATVRRTALTAGGRTLLELGGARP